jgi:hypothetical protein
MMILIKVRNVGNGYFRHSFEVFNPDYIPIGFPVEVVK